MGGRAQPVQQAGGGEDEGADADGGDTGAVGGRRAQGVEHLVGDRRGRVGAAGQDDRVGLGERVEAPGRPQREGAGVDLVRGAADADPVGGPAVRQPGPGEDLDRRGRGRRG